MAGFAQLAPHLPRDPDQQQATDEDQPDDLHELGDDEREGDAQHQRREDADQDHLLALRRGQARRQRADDDGIVAGQHDVDHRSEEHTSELQSLMRISYAVFCLKKKTTIYKQTTKIIHNTQYIKNVHNYTENS